MTHDGAADAYNDASMWKREVERLEDRIEIGICIATSIVKVDDLLQSAQAAVVHVRRGARDLS